MLTLPNANAAQMAGGNANADIECCCVEPTVGWAVHQQYLCVGGSASKVSEDIYSPTDTSVFNRLVWNTIFPLDWKSSEPKIGVSPVFDVGFPVFWGATDKELGLVAYHCIDGEVTQRLHIFAFREVEPLSFAPDTLSILEASLCDASDLYDHVRLWYFATCYRNAWNFALPIYRDIDPDRTEGGGELELVRLFYPNFWHVPASFIKPSVLSPWSRSASLFGSFAPAAAPLLSSVVTPRTTGGWVDSVDGWQCVSPGVDVDYGNIFGLAIGKQLTGRRRPEQDPDVTRVYTWIIDLPVAPGDRRKCDPIPWHGSIVFQKWAWPPLSWFEYCSGDQGPFTRSVGGGNVAGCPDAVFQPPPDAACISVEMGAPNTGNRPRRWCKLVVDYEATDVECGDCRFSSGGVGTYTWYKFNEQADCVEEKLGDDGWYDDGVKVDNPAEHTATSGRATWIGYFTKNNCDTVACLPYDYADDIPVEPPWDAVAGEVTKIFVSGRTFRGRPHSGEWREFGVVLPFGYIFSGFAHFHGNSPDASGSYHTWGSYGSPPDNCHYEKNFDYGSTNLPDATEVGWRIRCSDLTWGPFGRAGAGHYGVGDCSGASIAEICYLDDPVNNVYTDAKNLTITRL